MAAPVAGAGTVVRPRNGSSPTGRERQPATASVAIKIVASVDNRKGRLAPTSGQRAAAAGAEARWNALGTPATLTATGEPLEAGLSADPVTAAKAYVDKNLDVLGLTA